MHQLLHVTGSVGYYLLLFRPADSICEDLMSIKNRCHIYNQEKRITFTEIIELLPTANDPPIVGSPL